MMNDILLEVSGLTKCFAEIFATNNLSFDVQRGETHAIIGPNGAGKTTLIAQLQGELRPDAGSIRFGGRDITNDPAFRRAALGIARSFQITSVFPKFTALSNVAFAAQAQAGHSFRFWRDVSGDPRLVEPAREALELVGLLDRAHTAAENLSHGERRQLEIAMALAMRPTLLLLDEPMAGMGRSDGARMARLLADLKRSYTIVLVEHDMDMVFSLADRISVLVAGRTVATGCPAEIRGNAEVRAAYLGHKS
jgi:branched-chain amino acid transport system ATP-binding protein